MKESDSLCCALLVIVAWLPLLASKSSLANVYVFLDDTRPYHAMEPWIVTYQPIKAGDEVLLW